MDDQVDDQVDDQLCSARPSEAKLPATAAGSAAPMSQEIPAFKSSILENKHGYATLKSSNRQRDATSNRKKPCPSKRHMDASCHFNSFQ